MGFAIAFCFPRVIVKPSSETSSVEEIPDDSEIEFLPIRHYQRDERTLIADGASTVHDDVSNREQARPESTVTSSRDERSTVQPESLIPADADQPYHLNREADVAGRKETSVQSQSGAVSENERYLDASTGSALNATRSGLVPESSVASSVSESELEQSYVVRPGDTLSGIAHRTLGQASLFQKIFESNRDVLDSPDDLRPGLTLRIPPSGDRSLESKITTVESAPSNGADESQAAGDSLQISASEKTPVLPLNFIPPPKGRRHVVQVGETLESIAIRYYGSPKGVSRIRSENPTLTGGDHRLQPGTTLRIGGTP
ncbi:LysM peptidoglycan-binding domain-containing protein [Thalassoglobus sp. JC818]|uniref:LysM peptidoglycan-binding domain-containing protein n=1 Tax=Thalassoglobus sp. JC818 TaxID=3232136 RepID=UPI0034574FC9